MAKCDCKKENNESDGVNHLAIFGILGMFAIIIAFVVALNQPLEVEASCEFEDWKETPNGEYWREPVTGEKLTMYPDKAKCDFKGKITPLTIKNLGR